MLSYEAIAYPIRRAVDDLPSAILKRSGSIFYSGKNAFVDSKPLYILGLNPGGIPSDVPSVTIGDSIDEFKRREEPWSEYSDSSWEDAPPGTWGLQPRILHMLHRLRLDPQTVPSSNVVFVQSRGEKELGLEKTKLLESCWPLHQAVIDNLNIRTILCFGSTAGVWVRGRLGANELIDRFAEQNNRGWTSRTHRDEHGRQVVAVTHPSRVDWKNPEADPTPLVERALARASSTRLVPNWAANTALPRQLTTQTSRDSLRPVPAIPGNR